MTMLTRRRIAAIAAVAGSSFALPSWARSMSHARRPLTLTVRDIDVLARTIYGEARGEPQLGQAAIVDVVFNRVRSPAPIFADDITVAAACLREGQFSCWNRHMAALWAVPATSPLLRSIRSVIWRTARLYAAGRDISRGATAYDRYGIDRPDWARGLRPLVVIGRHAFYRMEGLHAR